MGVIFRLLAIVFRLLFVIFDSSKIDLLPEIYCKKPREQEGFDSVIVVDNIPKVGPPRIDKLKSVLKDKFSVYGKFIGEPFYALDESGVTKG